MTERPDDPFAADDAAYVLGALSPADRQRFEAHLDGCAECARSVRELAGLPGLLAQVTADMTVPQVPPPDLLPSVLRRARRVRRTRLALAAGAVTVAAAACVALAASAVAPDSAPQTPGTAMTALGQFPVTASAGLVDVSSGTKVDMACSYRGGKAGYYLLVAVGRDGKATELASWQAIPEDTARISVSTALHLADIDALEVRTQAGTPLLRLNPDR